MGPPREVEDSKGEDDMPPAHSAPTYPCLHTSWPMILEQGFPCPLSLCSRGSRLAHARSLASSDHLPSASCWAAASLPEGRLPHPQFMSSPLDTFGETLDYPLCHWQQIHVHPPPDGSHQGLPQSV